MPHNSRPVFAQGPSFQALEIEEPVDVYFFRPLGFVMARSAGTLGLTPNQLTILGMIVGTIGGALFYNEHFAIVGVGLLFFHNVFDSADGQLARLTARTSEFGRVLDGVGDYVTHAAIYIALTAGLLRGGGSATIMVWAAFAAIANILQAQMYEYHRYRYATIAVKRLIPHDEPAKITTPFFKWLYQGYLAMQRVLNGLHVEVESVIAARSVAGQVTERDQARYRECFRGPMHGWNLLGQNARFCMIGVLACMHRIELFFLFILVPMNLIFLTLWIWQRSADRKFLSGACSTEAGDESG